MRFLILSATLSILPISLSAASEELKVIQKKQRAEKHVENKKWKAMEEECKKKFPKFYDTNHADYDGHFKCREEIIDIKNAFDEKQNEELCQKLNIQCKKKE